MSFKKFERAMSLSKFERALQCFHLAWNRLSLWRAGF